MISWMFKCKEVSQMVSESMDRPLTRTEKIGTWLHLMMCSICNRYRKQLLSIRAITHRCASQFSSDKPPFKLSESTRQRIIEAIRKKSNQD